MLVRKCDNCKKEIKQLNEAVVAGIGFPEFSFCERCGKPILLRAFDDDEYPLDFAELRRRGENPEDFQKHTPSRER